MTNSKNIATLNEITFEQLFKSHFKALTGFAYKYLKDVDLAKEIVHDVFVKLWEKRDSIDPNKAVKSYLYASVNNKSLNYIRDNKKFIKSDDNFELLNNTDNTDASDNMIVIEIQEKIDETLSTLPEKCSLVFKMSRYEGKKYREIAEELNISIKTVESHMSKALKLLRKNLAEFITAILLLFLDF